MTWGRAVERTLGFWPGSMDSRARRRVSTATAHDNRTVWITVLCRTFERQVPTYSSVQYSQLLSPLCAGLLGR